MISFARNERGLRMISATILFLPLVCMIYSTSRSAMLDLVVVLSWFIFASISLVAFLWERAEEEERTQE